MPGRKKTMSIGEWTKLCESIGLLDESFTSREIKLCYVRGKQTSSDELKIYSHKRASFPEFLEIIGRVSMLRDVTLMLQDLKLQEHMMQSKALSYAFMFTRLNDDVDRIFQVKCLNISSSFSFEIMAYSPCRISKQNGSSVAWN